MFKDGQHLPRGDRLEFDVAIVGAGMAGITLAERLRGEGKRICLIEGGGVDPEASAQQLQAGENVGRSYFDIGRCRFRVFGGSTIRWGGWCRPFDPIDFTARDWIPLSGWPIDRQDLDRYYADAARIVELDTDSFSIDDWAERIPPPPPIVGTSPLEAAVIQHGHQVDFGERWRAALTQADDVTVLLHANATELVLDRAGDRLDHVRISTLKGRQFSVKADHFVLAAGGLENARLLLASGRDRGPGVGNESDFVGRCFMEHLHVASAYVVPDEGRTIPPFFEHAIENHGRAHGVLTPTEEALIAERLPSCSISLSPAGSAMGVIPRLNWPPALMAASETAARRLQRHHPAADAHVRRAVLAAWKAGRAAQLGRQARGSEPSAGGSVAIAHLRAEQVPNPDSRVTLGESRDALGVPRVRLDWKLSEQDFAGVQRWTDALADAFHDNGIGRVVPREGWRDDVIGGPHHLGTTRMSASPKEGVVDADCRVHSVDNLYVAGSSVFTTGGHANPSYMVLALTLRLADHLREQMGVGGAVPSVPALASGESRGLAACGS